MHRGQQQATATENIYNVFNKNHEKPGTCKSQNKARLEQLDNEKLKWAENEHFHFVAVIEDMVNRNDNKHNSAVIF